MQFGSVTIPCLASDFAAFERLIRLWNDPRFAPYENPLDQPAISLIIVLNNAATGTKDRFLEIFQAFPALRATFAGIEVFDAHLDAERDIYLNGESRILGPFGNKAGPNLLFFESMEIAGRFGGFTLLNELDCFPVRRGWLERLSELADSHPRTWVIGSTYAGQTPLDPHIQWHLNGNALYNAGDPNFIRFVQDVWKPRLLQLALFDPNLAYDCWFETERLVADNGRRNESWEIVTRYQEFFRAVPFLVNCLAGDDPLAVLRAETRRSHGLSSPPLLGHGHVFVEIVEELLADESSSFEGRYSQLPETGSAANQAGSPSRSDDPSDLTIVSRWPLVDGLTLLDVGDFPIVAIEIEKSCVIGVDEIDDGAFVGAWHKREAGLRWMGQGSAALLVRVPKGTVELGVLIRGHAAKSDEPLPITLRGLAGGYSTPITLPPDEHPTHRCPIPPDAEELWLLFRAERAAVVEGDTRDLAFALFGIAFELVRGS